MGNAASAGVIFLGPDPGQISSGTWGVSEGRSLKESLRSHPWSRGFLSFTNATPGLGCSPCQGMGCTWTGHKEVTVTSHWQEYLRDEEAVAASQLHGVAGGEGAKGALRVFLLPTRPWSSRPLEPHTLEGAWSLHTLPLVGQGPRSPSRPCWLLRLILKPGPLWAEIRGFPE